MKRLPTILLFAVLAASLPARAQPGVPAGLAEIPGEVSHLRLYMSDMQGWGELSSMSLLPGDTLFLSVLAEDDFGRAVPNQPLSILSRLGNIIEPARTTTDADGWAHIDVTAAVAGKDKIRFTSGQASAHFTLSVSQTNDAEHKGPPVKAKPIMVTYPGALSWKTLADVGPGDDFAPPQFGPAIRAHDGKAVKIQGFMLPLDNTEKQQHFIISANPPSCFYCLPGGPESLVEVFADEPLAFSYDPVVVGGTLELLKFDEMGLYYRLNNAKQNQ